ncbi:hypothetical protein KJ966_25710 [bacterium]|nr:hypothetical protein [bacterium]
MKIAILHYHLKPGGVTTVIRQQITAIQKFGEALIITGEKADEEIPVKTICVPGLAYDRVKPAAVDPKQVAFSTINAILSHWPDGCDLIHIHNPTLAKNKDLLKIIEALQASRQTLFLQIHDFAEDGRPKSFFQEPYPENCHYGVINRRDHKVLLSAGLSPQGTHLIENTIDSNVKDVQSAYSPSHILYPIRAIRRKNIGEAILISLFIHENLPLLITLPPNSPADIESYHFWQHFVRKHKLNIGFEAGLHHEFTSLIAASKFILTTSITEGFGFAFIEPWLSDKPIWGRYLPGTCDGFEEAGISLSHLYRQISVPLDWIVIEDFYGEWEKTVHKMLNLYKQPINRVQIKQTFEKLIQNHQIDFALLNEGHQAIVIKKVLTNRKDRIHLLEINPFLLHPGKIENVEKLIATNKAAIKKNYDPFAYQKILKNIYQLVIHNPIRHKINQQKLIEYFVKLEEFSLLKWGRFNKDSVFPLITD